VINAYRLSESERKYVLDLYRLITDADFDINYLFSGYKDGSLLINDYVPGPGFDSTKRPWYLEALKTPNKATEGIAYTDYNTKEWLLSVSRALINSEGEIVGVVSIDCKIDKILDLIKQTYEKYRSSLTYILKTDGTIIIYHDTSMLGNSYNKLTGQELDLGEEGDIAYEIDGVSKIGYYKKLDRINWIVVTVVDRNEIVIPIVKLILVIMLSLSCLSVIIWWIARQWLNANIVYPIQMLRQEIVQIVDGSPHLSGLPDYPENDIGFIAQEIKKLTKDELMKKARDMEELNQMFQLMAQTDYLTGLNNRRKMTELLETEFQRSYRYGGTFSVIILDIDSFKKINDTYGHAIGDRVIVDVANIIKEEIRESDFCGRWGGEEFIILCPNTNREQAYKMMERVRKAIAGYSFKYDNIDISVTISAGIGEYETGKSLTEVLAEADTNLYKAKQQGKNMTIK
jgi:diguanylate cyclase (GGDEF)-like protein